MTTSGRGMNKTVKSTVFGILLTLMCALGGGVGVATLIIKPFDLFFSIFIGSTFIISAVVCWWWSCFVRELYR